MYYALSGLSELYFLHRASPYADLFRPFGANMKSDVQKTFGKVVKIKKVPNWGIGNQEKFKTRGVFKIRRIFKSRLNR